MNNYLYALQQFREGAGSFLLPVFYFISEFANYAVLPIIVVLYVCIDKKKYTRMIFTYTLGIFTTNFIKLCACIYRPWILDSRLHVASIAEGSATGYSFPSGHTTSGTAFYGNIALDESRGKKRKGLIAFLIVMVGLTALSRNFLGCHSGKDVLVAIAVTTVLMFICDALLTYVDKNPEKDVLIGFILVAIAVMALIFFDTKSYPADYAQDGSLIVDGFKMQKDGWQGAGFLIGFVISWLADRQWIHFSTDISKKQKWIRAIVSVIVFAVFYLGIMTSISHAMTDLRAGAFLKALVTTVVSLGLMPAIFTRLEK